MAADDAIAAIDGEGAIPCQPLHSAAAWTAATAAAEQREWLTVLSPAEVEEVLAAAEHALSTGKPIQDLTAADFPLPTLGPKLAAMRRSCLHGRGFHMLRGFPVERLSLEEAIAAFFGLGTHWGHARSQNAKGHVVGHVQDLGLDPGANDVRVYQTRAAQPWHVDTCDLVALLCLKRARMGGCSRWVSSVSIYNRLCVMRPDLVEALMQPFYYDRKGEVPPGQLPYSVVPGLSFYAGYLTVYYNDRMTREAQRFPEVPRLTPKQEEALQAVTQLADSPELHLKWDLEPGDIQLLHNWNQLHMRTAFEDDPGPGSRRHLLRLHLSCKGARPLDPAVWGPNEPGKRHGVYTTTTRHTVPLEAE